MIPDNYKPIRQVGNGKTTSFSFDFPMLSENFIKVYREKDGIQELVDPSEYVWGYLPVEGDEPAEDLPPENVITFYEAPEEGTVIVIAREIPLEQTTPYKTSSGFPAVRVEDNFDKLTAITQQLMEEVDRCVKVEITNDQTSEELLAEVYGKLDSATEVAQEAVEAANFASEAVASAEKTLAEVNTYVDESKTEINALITKTTTEINQTIAEATEEIKEAAVAEAEKAIEAGVKAIEDKAIETTEGLDDAANKSRIWAEGEQAEVETLGGELSSRGFADFAYAIANAPEDVPLDNSNLIALDIVKGEKGDKGDKGDAGKDGVDGKSVFDGYATNCITEIPQDIKVELNNGVLTLKAGSKVYVPNGFEADGTTPKFDEVMIAYDVTVSGSRNGTAFTMWNLDDGVIDMWTSKAISSGSTTPTPPGNNFIWYDTANNIIKVTFDKGVTWTETRRSLPLGLISFDSASITSIDQVFNGFGYIGSTVFALPGVKGLIPNGRNADGSLRNIEFVNDIVRMQTLTSSFNLTNYHPIVLLPNSFGVYVPDRFIYKEQENLIWNEYDKTYVNGFKIADVTASSGVITSFQPKLPFRSVDYSDSSWVAQQAMPSDKYIDLTLGASGSSYTAPANGWFILRKTSNANSRQYLSFYAGDFNSTNETYVSGATVGSFFPCKKGRSVGISYTLGGATNIFRFYYAEGDK